MNTTHPQPEATMPAPSTHTAPSPLGTLRCTHCDGSGIVDRVWHESPFDRWDGSNYHDVPCDFCEDGKLLCTLLASDGCEEHAVALTEDGPGCASCLAAEAAQRVRRAS